LQKFAADSQRTRDYEQHKTYYGNSASKEGKRCANEKTIRSVNSQIGLQLEKANFDEDVYLNTGLENRIIENIKTSEKSVSY
jgi:hypothetical protein